MPVDYQVVLAAGPSPVDRRRSGVSPALRDVRAVDRGVVHVQQTCGPQLSQHHLMQ
jgi:hypothetical protein